MISSMCKNMITISCTKSSNKREMESMQEYCSLKVNLGIVSNELHNCFCRQTLNIPDAYTDNRFDPAVSSKSCSYNIT